MKFNTGFSQYPAGGRTFSHTPSADIPRSVMDLSHGHRTTFDAGYLVPVAWYEALPGDTFGIRQHCFVRMATLLRPIMENVHVDTFWFAIPYRLVMDNFQRMMGEQDTPGDSTDYILPVQTSPASTGYTIGSLQDHLGIPPLVGGLEHQALPMRAYNLTFNQWFRDQNLVDDVVVDKDDGPDDPADYTLLRRGKRKDYFTSCLPWPQKGDAVELPIGSTAPITGTATISGAGNPVFNLGGTTSTLQHNSSGERTAWTTYPGTGTGQVAAWSNPNLSVDTSALEADLSSATASTINQIRMAFQMQRLLERDARSGSRYAEHVQAHFGVTSPDQRLQRVELLGVGTQRMNINPVAATHQDQSVNSRDVGDLAAYAISAGSNHGFTKSFVEHCIVLGIVSVRADLSYDAGLDRKWSRSTRWDHYVPALAHLGEQAVLNKELWAQGDADLTADAGTFGYQERWAEYRFNRNTISGSFRTYGSGSLDFWTLTQEFASLPMLNEEFIEEDPPIDRVIAVQSEPHFLADFWFDFKAARPIPVRSVPGFVDHF